MIAVGTTSAINPPQACFGFGGNLYVTDFAGNIEQFGINSSNGSLTYSSIQSVSAGSGSYPGQPVVFDPNDGIHSPVLFTGIYGAISEIEVFLFAGAISPSGTISATSGLNPGLTISGNYLFAAIGGGVNQIEVFSVNSSGWPTSTGSSYSTADAPSCLAKNGGYLYVSLPSINQIQIFSINPSSGALTSIGSPITTHSSLSPKGLASDGKYLYVSIPGSGSSSIQAYLINSLTGALTYSSTLSSLTPNLWGLAVYGNYLYGTGDQIQIISLICSATLSLTASSSLSATASIKVHSSLSIVTSPVVLSATASIKIHASCSLSTYAGVSGSGHRSACRLNIITDPISLSAHAKVIVSGHSSTITSAEIISTDAYRTPVYKRFIHRQGVTYSLKTRLIHRSTSQLNIYKKFIHRSSNSGIVSRRLIHRAESAKEIFLRKIHKANLYTPVVPGSGMPANPPYGYVYGPGQPELPVAISSFEQAWRFGYLSDSPVDPNTGLPDPSLANRQFSVDISVAGPALSGTMELGCMPASMSLNITESAPATWGIMLQNAGYYHPMNTSSPWFEVMDDAPLVGDSSLPKTGVLHLERKEMIALITLCQTPFNFRGLGTAWSHEIESKQQRFEFSWKGVDHSQKLSCEGQTMKDVKSKPNALIYSQFVLAEILTRYGVQYNLRHLPDNFPIVFLSRQNGRPIDWIQQILGVSLAEWIMVGGDVFTPYLPNPTATPQFNYFLDGPGVVDSESYSASMQNVCNKLTVIRAVDAGGGAVTVECNNFGQYTATFPTPISMPRWNVVTQQGGLCSDYECYNSAGQLIAYRESRLASFTPLGAGSIADGGAIQDCAKIIFTFGHLPFNLTDGVTSGYAKVTFTGTVGMSGDSFGGTQFDGQTSAADPLPGFKCTVINSSSIAKYGIRAVEVTANPLIPTKRDMQIYAMRYLYRLMRQEREASYKVPYNPAINPGVNVSETYRPWGIVGRSRLVTKVQHAISNRPENRYTIYTGNEYPDPGQISLVGSESIGVNGATIFHTSIGPGIAAGVS